MMKQPGLWLAAVSALIFILIAPVVQPPWFLSIMVIVVSILLYSFEKTKYISYAMIAIALLYGLTLLPLLVFSATLAIITFGELVYRETGGRASSFIAYIAAAVISCSLIMLYLQDPAILTIVFGILVAVLLKAILREREDALMIEALGIAMTMLLIEELNFHAELSLIVLAVGIAFGFGYFSYRLKTSDLSGLFSVALIGIILIVFADVTWFLVMLVFFIVASACTRYRYRDKAEMGVEQSQGGARGYRNVFANGVVSAAAAILYGVTTVTTDPGIIAMQPAFIALFIGSVATAAADTVASEIGVTGGPAYLITSGKRVPAGTNGGITLLGETAGLFGAVIVVIAAFLLGIIDSSLFLIGISAGFIGTNIDSVIGAVIENRGWIGNAGTNLLATLGGGLCALALYLLI
jgi:uncharacterized protein (TIGR00297 family)